MNVDHTQILKLAESNNGIVTLKLIQDELNWSVYRIENLFNFMIREGIVWLDEFSDRNGLVKKSYYFPSLFIRDL